MPDNTEHLDPRLAKALAELQDREPARDLWPGIAPRLQPRLPRGTLLLRWPAALAAGLLVAVASAGATYFVLNNTTPLPSVVATLERSALVVATPVPTAAVLSAPADSALLRAIGDLETLLASHQDRLDPATRSSLSRTLAALDAAITDATTAKANDPESSWASRYLTATLRRKLDMLQAVVVRTSTTS